MENYKELADRLEKRYKANETGSTFVTLCSRRDVLNAATAIAELMARAEAAERQRDEAMADLEATRAALAEAHGLVGVTPKTMFGVPLARLHQLAEADKAGSILGALDMAKVACALQELNKYKELGGLDYLRELVEAEREGRCGILSEPILPVVCRMSDTDCYCPSCGENLSSGWPYDVGDHLKMLQCPHCGQSIDDEHCVESVEQALKERGENG